MLARLRDLLRRPTTDFVLLVVGLVVAGAVAPLTGDEVSIVTGGELGVLALLRLAVAGELRWLMRGVVLTGLAIPVIAGSTSPLFYPGPFRPENLAATAAVALFPGLIIAGFGAFGLSRAPAEPPPPTPRAVWVSRALRVAVWFPVLALSSGQWGPLTIAATLLGSLAAFAGLVVLLTLHLRLTRATVGALVGLVGLFVVGVAALLVATQGGRVSGGEAALAAVPGLGLALLGGGLWASAPRAAAPPPG